MHYAIMGTVLIYFNIDLYIHVYVPYNNDCTEDNNRMEGLGLKCSSVDFCYTLFRRHKRTFVSQILIK